MLGMVNFKCDDGTEIQPIKGFRKQLRASHESVTPQPTWGDAQYASTAAIRLRRYEHMEREILRFRPSLDGADVLEVGCGDGVNCTLLARAGVRRVVGIDLQLRLFLQEEQGQRVRRLADAVLRRGGSADDLETLLRRRPLEFHQMDARSMSLADASFDVLLSRSAMEHIMPIDAALAEMIRVVRPGGLIHHGIDPFFWLRGCHKRGLADLPWAHARLSDSEFHRFVSEQESPAKADKRLHRLQTLNRFTLRQWRALVEQGPVRVLEWRQEPSPQCRELLAAHPEVLARLVPGVEEEDLLCHRIHVWLQRL